MKVFRLAATPFARSRKEAFSGQGGLQTSARWHTAGRPIVYTAQSLSLAALEILVHLKRTTDIQSFQAFTAEIPDDLILKPDAYPSRWRARVAISRTFGDTWLEIKPSPALRVPAVITPGEWNILLDPLHPKFTLDWVVSGPEKFVFDTRLTSGKSTHKR